MNVVKTVERRSVLRSNVFNDLLGKYRDVFQKAEQLRRERLVREVSNTERDVLEAYNQVLNHESTMHLEI